MYGSLIDALPAVLSLGNFAAVVLGVITGICIGALPGLSATMAISVLIPFTFGMDPLVALGMMAGIYNGAMYGGAIPAVLLRIPGTPAAVATSFDGYPMAQQGAAMRFRCQWYLPPSAASSRPSCSCYWPRRPR
ncbi:hypothetical protein HSBAA_61950 [Vreelandella sulfidaeris]|uniref:DUF112 domain-containing protein n=1 Tax=Vreelandella sulfidaeris TaxID=115553 RepID=A0A455UKW3_9GAMM|nr:hypothetical protein HSBAA_61950 [Halomonas sulfidaeris]